MFNILYINLRNRVIKGVAGERCRQIHILRSLRRKNSVICEEKYDGMNGLFNSLFLLNVYSTHFCENNNYYLNLIKLKYNQINYTYQILPVLAIFLKPSLNFLHRLL